MKYQDDAIIEWVKQYLEELVVFKEITVDKDIDGDLCHNLNLQHLSAERLLKLKGFNQSNHYFILNVNTSNYQDGANH